ncbi:hypothetical protein C8R48DRAFT_767384 [Suillus tomentosus]|nr:hypothetical protein C8R48DRAFT_767384 [Suillus tomentosus]
MHGGARTSNLAHDSESREMNSRLSITSYQRYTGGPARNVRALLTLKCTLFAWALNQFSTGIFMVDSFELNAPRQAYRKMLIDLYDSLSGEERLALIADIYTRGGRKRTSISSLTVSITAKLPMASWLSFATLLIEIKNPAAWGGDIAMDNDEAQEDIVYGENYSMDVDDNGGEQDIKDIDIGDANEGDFMEVDDAIIIISPLHEPGGANLHKFPQGRQWPGLASPHQQPAQLNEGTPSPHITPGNLPMRTPSANGMRTANRAGSINVPPQVGQLLPNQYVMSPHMQHNSPSPLPSSIPLPSTCSHSSASPGSTLLSRLFHRNRSLSSARATSLSSPLDSYPFSHVGRSYRISSPLSFATSSSSFDITVLSSRLISLFAR